jgi:hypothetical protein
VLTGPRLDAILAETRIEPAEREKVVDFMLYYGVLGTSWFSRHQMSE